MTAPSADVAQDIVTKLVDERLIACGNITKPVASIYRWQGTTERASEVLVIMKTTANAVPRLTRRIAQLHPYEVPEVLTLPVIEGYEPYLDWVIDNVAEK
jgi:periplasmic divalent cation tolerance protein